MTTKTYPFDKEELIIASKSVIKRWQGYISIYDEDEVIEELKEMNIDEIIQRAENMNIIDELKLIIDNGNIDYIEIKTKDGDGINSEKLNGSLKDISNFSEMKLTSIHSPPKIYFNDDGNISIINGRHRMYNMKRLGYKKIPVVITSYPEDS